MTLHLGYMRIMNFNVCLFLCVVVAVVIAICVLVFMWICLMCAKKNRTPARNRAQGAERMPTHLHVVRNARPHAHIFYSFFSVLLWKEWVLHNIMHSFLLGYHVFFFIFFWQMLKMAERNLGKNQQAFLRTLFLGSVTKSMCWSHF